MYLHSSDEEYNNVPTKQWRVQQCTYTAVTNTAMYLHSSNEEYSNVPTKQWQVQQCTNTAVTRLFCWYFEPSQPQRITSGLKQTSICLPIYYAHKSSNHKFSKNHKISPNTNLHKTNVHKHQTQNVRRIGPFCIAPNKKKKAHKARTHWYRGPFRRFINTRF